MYFFVGALVSSYIAYLLYFTFLRGSNFAFHYALTNHAISVLLSILAVLTGLSAAGTQSASFLLLFPHKWLGITLSLYTLLTFVLLWIKGKDLSRRVGVSVSLLGLLLSLSVFTLGWLLRGSVNP